MRGSPGPTRTSADPLGGSAGPVRGSGGTLRGAADPASGAPGAHIPRPRKTLDRWSGGAFLFQMWTYGRAPKRSHNRPKLVRESPRLLAEHFFPREPTKITPAQRAWADMCETPHANNRRNQEPSSAARSHVVRELALAAEAARATIPQVAANSLDKWSAIDASIAAAAFAAAPLATALAAALLAAEAASRRALFDPFRTRFEPCCAVV